MVSEEADHVVVEEFFELFKTPWEFYRPGVEYEVLLCSKRNIPENSTKLILLSGAKRQTFDETERLRTSLLARDTIITFQGARIPLHGNCLYFEDVQNPALIEEKTRRAIAVERSIAGRTVVRLGFDPFDEVRHLLREGQPPKFALIPTLDLHIALVRAIIVNHGILLLEIPPVPGGYSFIACLTHDVDHPGIRYHKCDHTMFGFLYRALLGSFLGFCRGRRSAKHLLTNWKAALSLPFVYAGWAKDFWRQFDRYLDFEKDLASTFFVLPAKDDPGIDPHGQRRSKRASRYAAADIAEDLRKLLAPNREVGLHGIDAWRDAAKGRAERNEINKITGDAGVGVRMHWLYCEPQSAATLEEAGFSYDSTAGYNETIGYRAGTGQVYKPLDVQHLLELPLHIMDTALFYPSYMNLSADEAHDAMLPLLENANRFGGVLTLNWHDRSLAPERLWGDVYATLLAALRARNPWFATGSQAVLWFQKRRATSFASIREGAETLQVDLNVPPGNDDLPPLKVRVHNLHLLKRPAPAPPTTAFADFEIDAFDRVLIAA